MSGIVECGERVRSACTQYYGTTVELMIDKLGGSTNMELWL